MIVGSVSTKDIRAKQGTPLTPATYLCPAKDVDEAIARTERTIARAKRHLVKLHAERDRRLEGLQTIYPDVSGYYAYDKDKP